MYSVNNRAEGRQLVSLSITTARSDNRCCGSASGECVASRGSLDCVFDFNPLVPIDVHYVYWSPSISVTDTICFIALMEATLTF